MWEVITSQGHRARDIQHESDALHVVHSLGLTTLIAPYRYLVSDYRGQCQRSLKTRPLALFENRPPNHDRMGDHSARLGADQVSPQQ
jgi:hypothetical protein